MRSYFKRGLKILARSPSSEAIGGSQEGSATIIMAGASLIVVMCMGFLASLWHVYVSKRQVYNVAELSALSAADAARGLIRGQPCRVAGDIALEHRMEVETCDISGDLLDIVTVRVKYKKNLWLELSALARAGSPRYQEEFW